MNNISGAKKSDNMDLKIEGNTIKIQLKDGSNYTSRVVKRGYLRHEEINNLIMIYTTAQLIEGIRSSTMKPTDPMWEVWERSGIVTKEQKKNLKTALTFMRKFVNDVFNNNLDVKTKDNIVKRLQKWEIKVVDDYTLRKVYDMLDKNKDYSIDKDIFFDLISAQMTLQCQNCTKDRCECEFHTFLEKYLIPTPTGYSGNRNCEYSFNTESNKSTKTMEITGSEEFFDFLDWYSKRHEIKEERFGNNVVYSEGGKKIAENTKDGGPRIKNDLYSRYLDLNKKKEA